MGKLAHCRGERRLFGCVPVRHAGLFSGHGAARATTGGCLKDGVLMIPIERIRILNPRHREKKKFELIVQSIQNLGLKKPIQVSLRSAHEAEEPGYDLVCGQGRLEAFVALGHKEIPAIVVEVSKEDRLLRSLIENMARRLPSTKRQRRTSATAARNTSRPRCCPSKSLTSPAAQVTCSSLPPGALVRNSPSSALARTNLPRNAFAKPSAMSSATASTAWTATRWPWTSAASRSGWKAIPPANPSPFSTTASAAVILW